MALIEPMDKNLTEIWNAILEELKKTVSEGNFGTILKPTFLVSFEDDIATIGASSQIMVGLIQKRFGEQIKAAFQAKTGKDIDLIFIVKSNPNIFGKTGKGFIDGIIDNFGD